MGNFMRVLTLISFMLILGLMPNSPAFSKAGDLFGSTPIKIYPSSNLSPWQNVLARHHAPAQSSHDNRILRWYGFIDSIKYESKVRQMVLVDQWFRQFNYKVDKVVYNQNDYWTSPYEFLTYGGDCEDYAIIKYMSLRQLGFAADSMKIALVYDTKNKQEHAVLVVNYDGVEYVLDTQDKITVDRFIKTTYIPHLAFNENNVWAYNSPLIADYIKRKK